MLFSKRPLPEVVFYFLCPMNSRFAQSDRDQLMMFSRTLGDNLDKNHEIYAFVKLLDTIDMNPFLSRYSHEGGKAYHPSLMLGVLFYGFHRGWRSSREFQKCKCF